MTYQLFGPLFDFLHGLVPYEVDESVRAVFLAIGDVQHSLVSLAFDTLVLVAPMVLLYWLGAALIGGFERASNRPPTKHRRHPTW